ncbi:hypothetical protein [Nocardiopsis sp. LOL_012]|uniref:hypothetical protein n=1 Tax=Nocardiopsis sp. LOL_012 TaxID=3345409 RepID=UPI003A8C0CCA
MAVEPRGTSTIQGLHRLRAAYRRRGWTVWHGNATGQYWAAHTGLMVLLSGDSAPKLAAQIERVQPGGSMPTDPASPPTPAQARRRRAGLRLPPRPRPRGHWSRPGTVAGPRP